MKHKNLLLALNIVGTYSLVAMGASYLNSIWTFIYQSWSCPLLFSLSVSPCLCGESSS